MIPGIPMNRTLADSLARAATTAGGSTRPLLAGADTLALSREFSLPPARIDAQALRLGIMPARYQRNHSAFSHVQQIRLLESTVCLVGLGGLGGIVLEGLARLGVGCIRGADGDVAEVGNCNRQLLATEQTLGMNKAAAARERMEQINPCVRFKAVEKYLCAEEMAEFLDGADLAVDCLGGLEYRLALQNAAQRVGIPMVTGAIAGWSGYVGTVGADVSQSAGPGREGHADGTTGPAHLMARFAGSGTAAEDSLGTQAPGVYTVGALMCCQAAQMLGTGTASLLGKMLVMDLLSMDFEKVDIAG